MLTNDKKFQNQWILWQKEETERNKDVLDYMVAQIQIFEIGSLQDLIEFSDTKYWKVLSYFEDQILFNTTQKNTKVLSLFKKGIQPIWEDAKNKYGSSFQFSIRLTKSKQIQKIWENLICEFISDSFLYNQHINGIRVINKLENNLILRFEIWIDLGSERFGKNQQEKSYEKRVLIAVCNSIQKIVDEFYSKNQKIRIYFKEHLDKVY